MQCRDMGWTLLVHRACTVSKREASPVPSLLMATTSSAVRACSVSTRSVTLRWASSSRSAFGSARGEEGRVMAPFTCCLCGKK